MYKYSPLQFSSSSPSLQSRKLSQTPIGLTHDPSLHLNSFSAQGPLSTPGVKPEPLYIISVVVKIVLVEEGFVLMTARNVVDVVFSMVFLSSAKSYVFYQRPFITRLIITDFPTK